MRPHAAPLVKHNHPAAAAVASTIASAVIAASAAAASASASASASTSASAFDTASACSTIAAAATIAATIATTAAAAATVAAATIAVSIITTITAATAATSKAASTREPQWGLGLTRLPAAQPALLAHAAPHGGDPPRLRPKAAHSAARRQYNAAAQTARPFCRAPAAPLVARRRRQGGR